MIKKISLLFTTNNSFVNRWLRSDGEPIFVEIGEGVLKRVELVSVDGKKKISQINSFVLHSPSLERTLEEGFAHITKTSLAHSTNLILNIPRHSTIIKYLRLPSIHDAEIDSMAKAEALRQLPCEESDIIIANKVIQKYEDGYSEVLSAIILKKKVDGLRSAAQSAGLRIQKIALGSESMLLWFLKSRPELRPKTVLVVNVDETALGVDVFEEGQLVFTRGTLLTQEAERRKESILEEMSLSASAYLRRSSKKLDGIYLHDPLGLVQSEIASLSKAFDVSVELIEADHFTRLDNSGPIPKDASYIELLGLSLGYQDARIDLSTKELKDENSFFMFNKEIVKTFVFIMLITLGLTGILAKVLYNQTASLNLLEKELKKEAPRLNELKSLLESISAVKGQINQKPLAIDFYAELYKVTPENIKLSLVDYTGGKAMTLRGSSTELNQIFAYAQALEKSDLFEQIKVRYASKRLWQGSESADFEIAGVLAGIDQDPSKKEGAEA